MLEQLERGVDAHDVKVDILLSTIKALHAKQIVENFMKESKDLIFSCFKMAHISEAAIESATLINFCENPFQEIGS